VTVERTGDIPGRQLSADLAHGLDLLSHGLELPVHLPAEPLERLTLVPYRFRLSICLLEGGRLLLDPVEEVGRKSIRLHLFADGGELRAEVRSRLVVDAVRRNAPRPPDRNSRALDERHGSKEVRLRDHTPQRVGTGPDV
jgi:hypothetical protein